MKITSPILAMSLALGFAACSDAPVAPASRLGPADAALARPTTGTGLSLTNFTSGLPLVGDVQITEVVITGLSTALGGLQASGTITGTTVNALGQTITVTDDFTTDVLVSSSGAGQCGIVSLDLGPIAGDVFGVVGVDIPTANVNAKASGAVGPLLCALGSVVNGVAGAAVGGILNALNGLLGGSLPAPAP
jgi:hypothetical protein